MCVFVHISSVGHIHLNEGKFRTNANSISDSFYFSLPFLSIHDDDDEKNLPDKTDGATIESISDNVVVNPGDEAKLACAVKGTLL